MRRCAICKEPISKARLRARPDARLCTTCKSNQDEDLITAGAPAVRHALVEMSELDGEQVERIVWTG
jgi:RNA polymerase-binding transcription factor DksA